MKTFLYYLNWALHDFNYFMFNTIWLNVKIYAYAAGFCAIPFGLYLLIGDYVFWLLVLYFPAVFWLTISYLVKRDSEKVEQVEITDQFGMSHSLVEKNEPLTWKESLAVGAQWVWYTVVVMSIAFILLVFFGEEIHWFIWESW
jgi:hypothetical protein